MSAPATAAVLGAGTMGRGIALALVQAGVRVSLHDPQADAVLRAVAYVRERLEQGVRAGRLQPDDADAALARIQPADTLEAALADAELVIEAAPEDLVLKRELLAACDRHAPIGTILATNTSVLSITEIAAATRRPGAVVGMHFFNPAERMPLVEVVRGLRSDPAVIERVVTICHAIGKTPVVVNEAPGFATSRLSTLLGNEAMLMLTEGVADAEAIDTAVRLGLGHPMGPLELADLVGLDVRLRNLRHLHGALGERFRPAPLLERLVAAGRLGRKSGEGVFRYAPDGRRLPSGHD